MVVCSDPTKWREHDLPFFWGTGNHPSREPFGVHHFNLQHAPHFDHFDRENHPCSTIFMAKLTRTPPQTKHSYREVYRNPAKNRVRSFITSSVRFFVSFWEVYQDPYRPWVGLGQVKFDRPMQPAVLDYLLLNGKVRGPPEPNDFLGGKVEDKALGLPLWIYIYIYIQIG